MAFDFHLTITPRTPISRLRNFFRKIFNRTRRDTAEWIHGSMIEVFEEVSHATPYRTGAAMNSWVLSVGSPVFKDLGSSSNVPGQYNYPPTPRVPIVPVDKKGRLKDEYFLSNGVGYIERLNAGWSDQQPIPGWIEDIIQQTLNARR